MSGKSTPHRYGNVAITLHWVSAILIISLLISGLLMQEFPNIGLKETLLRLHAPMGMAIFSLMIFRLIWWWRFDTKPRPLENNSKTKNYVAKLLHRLFYVITFILAASGIGMLVLSGAGAILFTGAEGSLPDFENLPPRSVHCIASKLMLLLLFVHIAAALHHRFIKRDATLSRILFKPD